MPAKKADRPANKLTWPAGAAETPTRRAWFARVSALPPGLTVRQVADRLRRSDFLVRWWMLAFGYAPADGMADRRAAGAAKWAGVNWDQTDAAIAARVGVSPQAVRLQRRRRQGPPPAGPAARVGG